MAATNPPPRAMLEELYARKEDGTLRDYPSFAEEKFYQCTDAEGLALDKKLGGGTICLARLDIVYFLDGYRMQGVPPVQALARFKRTFASSPKDAYPDALVEQLVPMVYRATTSEDNYELRRFVFETCLFPEEWKVWSQSTRRKNG